MEKKEEEEKKMPACDVYRKNTRENKNSFFGSYCARFATYIPPARLNQ